MRSPFVDRMATIQETIDNPTPPNMAEQQGPGYKLVRVAEANSRSNNMLNGILKIMGVVVEALFLRAIRVFQLWQVTTYVALLVWTSTLQGAGTSPKLFALSQLLDLVPAITDLAVAIIASFCVGKHDGDAPGVYIAEGNGVPGIDLIVATCKEPIDIILDTVKACLDLDYPKHKLRIIVSDDGKEPALQAALAPLGHVDNNLMYFTRTIQPGKHHGYKAGNMNAVLNMLESEGLKPNPWVANLDCDMIPDRETLRVLIAPALKDKKVGLVALPQDFYNIPVNDPLHENLVLQHQRDQMGRDIHDAAWCVGSGFIFSREAWKAVGGFFEHSMCDDVWFGWSLNGAGFKTAHVNACHQSGLQPESFQDHMKQRRRWFVGGMRNCKTLRFGFNAPILKGMTRMQKLFALKQIPMPYLSTLIKGIVAALNVTSLILGIVYAEPVVNVNTERFTQILLAYACYRMAGLFLDSVSAMTWGHNIRRRAVVSVWQGMHLARGSIVEELPNWLGGYALGFQPTGTKGAGQLVLNERDASVRPSFGIRLSIAQQTEGVFWHIVYFLIVTALTLWNVHHITWAARNWSIMWVWLMCGPLFPGLKLENVFCHLSPIWYLLKPPTMPDRKELMYLDERTGGYRPKAKYRGVRFTRVMWFWEILNIASVVWALFAYSKMNEVFDGIRLARRPSLETRSVLQLVLDLWPALVFGFLALVIIAVGVNIIAEITVDSQVSNASTEPVLLELVPSTEIARGAPTDEPLGPTNRYMTGYIPNDTQLEDELATLMDEAAEFEAVKAIEQRQDDA